MCACDKANTNNFNIYVEGAATDLFLFTLAKIANLGNNAERKYEMVITYLVKPRGSLTFPLEKMVTRFGFVPCRVGVATETNPLDIKYNNPSEVYYFILYSNQQQKWQTTLALRQSVPHPLSLCPIDTNTNIPQCAGGRRY